MPVGSRHRNWAIVLFATRGLAHFVENALFTIKRCGIDTSIVEVLFPANAECEIASVATVFGARPRILEQLLNVQLADMPANYANYGSPEFNNVMKYRFPALRAITAEGKCVIYSDVDVAWLRSPLEYLTNVLDYFPCALQTEALPAFPPRFCLGFCALSDSSACLEIIDHFIARYAEDGTKPLQPVFRDMLIQNPRFFANIFPLPEGLFPNGLLYRAVEFDKEPPLAMAGRLQPFIFHSNWVRGLEMKRRLLIHSRLWFVPETNGSIGLAECGK